jgi:hypothetical protein
MSDECVDRGSECPSTAWATARHRRADRESPAATRPLSMDAMQAAGDAIPMLVHGRDERPCASLRSRRPALFQSGGTSQALDTGTMLPQSTATDLVDQDTSRSAGRPVDSYLDGHAVG